jgi:hypothetical protein
MNRTKLTLLLISVVSVFFASCSGPLTGCVSNCGGGGTTTVSLTLVADTLPANPSLLSFKVAVASITLTPSSGAAQVFTPATPIVVDLMRLQSDSAYLGTLLNVPSGTYTVQIALANPELVFLNDTTSSISANGVNCAAGVVCSVMFASPGSPVVAGFSLTAASNGKQGFVIDFNLNNAISLSGGTLTVNFTPMAPSPGVLSAFKLPRANANLSANQLDLIEDFTGVVSLSGSTVTITSPVRGAIAGSAASAFFDASPAGNICQSPASIACVTTGQIASVDAILNSDGTLSIKEFEPLLATQQDLVEGIVYSVNSATQFRVAVTDKVQLAANSLIGGLSTGDLLTVNLTATPTFLVDSKGLAVQNSFNSSYNQFAGQTTTSAIHPGQTVAIHASAFTAANGATLASTTADTVILRWTRFRANVVNSTSATVNINGIPSYFFFTANSQEVAQAFLNNALGSDGTTNLDGVALNASGLNLGHPVGLRVLYLQNATNTANPAFFTAKIRQP